MLAMLLASALTGGRSGTASAPPLRVCADPNNLPFSNRRREGLENALAPLVAAELGRPLAYVWVPQRRGFVRGTLDAGACDVMIEVPAHFDRVLATGPYYRSSYVFVSRADRGLDLRSFDDPRLRTLRIGVQVVGDDYANTPPVGELARRGIVDNVVGYSVYGDYATPNPPARIVDAVAAGAIDVAVVWGPLAGFFAGREPAKLAVTVPVEAREGASLAFDVAMGVRRGDEPLRDALDGAIRRRRAEIDAILARFGVPRLR